MSDPSNEPIEAAQPETEAPAAADAPVEDTEVAQPAAETAAADTEMFDVPDDPNDPDVDEDAMDEDDDDVEEKATKEAAASDTKGTPTSETTPAPRKRGRPPGSKNKATLVRESEIEEAEEALMLTSFSAAGGFGPGNSPAMRSGSARWAARGRGSRGGTSHLVMVPRDENGNPYPVEDDELLLPEDPAGEVKVNKLGELQGGREYRVRTFTVLGRGKRLYMLSTEPARCMGFRDSYLLFQKHRRLHKVIADDEEKFDLIERELIPHSYKGRSIGIVTARSVFREFGAKIVLGGKKVKDDYYVQEAIDAGSVEGEVADPDDPFNQGLKHSKNMYVAWLGGAPAPPPPPPVIINKPIAAPSKRRKMPVIDSNWMLEHALAASRYNSALVEQRKETPYFVDPLTGVNFVPALSQPTIAEWFKVSRAPARASKRTVVSEEMQFSPVTRTGLQVPFDLNDIDFDETTKEAILDQLEVEGEAV